LKNHFDADMAVHPALRSWSGVARGVLVRACAYLGAIAIMAFGAAELLATAPAVATASVPLPRSPWIEANRPHPAFALTLPSLADAEHHYAIRRHAAGGGRKDILTFGDITAEGPFAVIEVYRPGKEPVAFMDPMRELAVRLSRADIADELRPTGTLDSKFGPVALVDFSLRRQRRYRGCTGFVRTSPEARMQIVGWFCSPGPEPMAHTIVGCALDRLSVLSAGNDPAMAQHFARAELNRDFCRQKDPILYARIKRPR
jgi:hypothetical protein